MQKKSGCAKFLHFGVTTGSTFPKKGIISIMKNTTGVSALFLFGFDFVRRCRKESDRFGKNTKQNSSFGSAKDKFLASKKNSQSQDYSKFLLLQICFPWWSLEMWWATTSCSWQRRKLPDDLFGTKTFQGISGNHWVQIVLFFIVLWKKQSILINTEYALAMQLAHQEKLCWFTCNQ